MTPRSVLDRLLQQEHVNFLLTNRLPRRQLTRLLGWFSQIEQPWISRLSIAIWRLFAEVDLGDARKRRFSSLHDCFIRELQEGARPIDPDPETLVSPCDAILGSLGSIGDGTLLQAKGQSYELTELLGDASLVRQYLGGSYATLRLTAGMYHRFHAPYRCSVQQVTYLPGDTWNVNPHTLKRIERLYCRNERATILCRLPSGQLLTLVPIAAILVASIRLHFLDLLLHLEYRGPEVIRCDVGLEKGQEMGWFQHGSTMIVLATREFTLREDLYSGARLRVGQALFKWRGAAALDRPVAGEGSL